MPPIVISGLRPLARQLSLVAATLLLPVLAVAQEVEEPDQPMFTSADVPWLILMGVIFLALIGGLVWYFVRGYSNFSETTSYVESSFEREILNEFGEPASSQKIPAQAVAVAAPPVPAAPPEGKPAGGLEDLARRLQQLTILADREGTVSLAVPPHGVIYRLRRGGTALLLPRLESMEAMGHFAKRFDVVIVAPQGTDDPLILSRLQLRLQDLMDRPGDFDAPKL